MKAIEAGARADLLPCPFCGGSAIIEIGQHNFEDAFVRCNRCGSNGPTFDNDKAIGGTSLNPANDATEHWNTRAIASGSLVPVAQLAAERERCAQAVRDERLEYMITPDDHSYNRALDHAEHAIRALSPEPGGGEFVVVPRIPTQAMILAGHHQIDWCRDDQQTHVPEHPSQHEGVGTTCKQDICDAWTAMLTAATKDGERA